MKRNLLRYLSGVSDAEETRRARAELDAEAATLRAPFDADERAFHEAMEERSAHPHLHLAESLTEVPLRMRLADLAGAHGWISGATGSGKTRLALRFATELLRHALAGLPVSVIVLSLQGNFGELVLRALGELIVRGASARNLRLTTARFFHGTTLPEWQLLSPEVGTPNLLQAATIAEVIENALGAALGGRQETALTMLLGLAIERGLSVNALRILMGSQSALISLGRESADPLVRMYFTERFAREAGTTLDGLASRLDRLLLIDPGLRGAFAGPGTIPFARLFEPGAVSVFDLSGSPLGAEGARRAIAALLVQSIAGAALSSRRSVRGSTFLLLDEVQLAFTPATVRTLETLLTTVRQFGVGLTFVNQSVAQLPRDFVQLLSTNIRYRFLGRSGRDDAALSNEFLRVAEVPKRGALTTSRVASRRGVSSQVPSPETLADRHFYYTERPAPFVSRELVALESDPPSLRALPAGLREGLLRGVLGRPREALIAHGQRIEEETLDLLRQSPTEGPRRGRARPAPPVPETPNVVAETRGWPRTRRSR